MPSRGAKGTERGDLFMGADITGDEMGLGYGDKEFAVFRIEKHHEFGHLTDMVEVFFYAEVFADAIVKMDDEVTG